MTGNFKKSSIGSNDMAIGDPKILKNDNLGEVVSVSD
jgi:hypothetical protein